ncbi:nitric oxide synthase-interacting protein [Kwoniella mangroviensis CBS 10435]|uniref:Nitric oxide synthase-interacting protein n=1 Tax=Kwoniella mangroviensis CBS 10435 TaxID=1331196 RepID=A0A1B9IH74_9TREE|nr:nitric oxide synthase-interacting protein [Kwoniella mangroviensis CBS 10435]
MTRSHAKNNTTQSTLSYYERTLLRKDGAARRLGRDSFKPLDACYLCLSKVNDPVSCSSGHIYCRECCISDLISQKAGIEAKKREMERWEESERSEREEAKLKARERVVSDFEKGMSLGGSSTVKRIPIGEDKDKSTTKSKFELDNNAVEKVAKEAEEKALRVMELEQSESRKAKLAAFWLPSLTPEAKLGPLKDVKLQTLCHVGGSPHPISRKTLLPVILTYPPSSTSKPICPTCTKELSNATSSILLSSRQPIPSANGDGDEGRKKKKQKKDKEEAYVCGHVICQTCSDTIVKPQGRCCVCDAKVEVSGRIPLGKEGTGFAAAGGAEVKREGVAFRV